ncbi:BON domain-containing protein [Granulicella sp. WH15]|nr:BON domain-containing protein [Granulicella sp. WH15]
MKNAAMFKSLVLGCVLLVGGHTAPAQGAAVQDQKTQVDINKSLSNKRFKDVKSTVQDGVVTLTGSVALYFDKKDAEHRIRHAQGLEQVHNEIVVAGPVVEDETLRDKLGNKLVYDRVGYGTTMFNALTIGVKNGVVTLGGVVYGPVDKSSALDLVETYPGVKDVVDNIEVAPLSPNDDRLRVALRRAVYGAPQLNRYAMDPGKPIRITVINGNATLSGVVDTQADKDIAFLQANSVAGVFKVVNNIQVVGREK